MTDRPDKPDEVEVEQMDPTEDEQVDETEDDEVPEGSVDEVMEWVGDDPDRAQAALDAENESDSPRSTLVQKLESLTS